MRDQPKQLGVYVPPPREKSRPLDERIARVKSRGIPKQFLDATKPDQREGSLARLLGTSEDDWARRKAQHLEFLETTEALGEGECFYRIRYYIRTRPFECAGRWQEEWIDDDGEVCPAHWAFEPRAVDYFRAVEKVRAHLIKTFREILQDAICPHNQSWDDWEKRFTWDHAESAGCASCFVECRLKEKGKDPQLASFPDAKVCYGNTKGANTILAILGLSKRNEIDTKHESGANEAKLEQIHAAKKRDALIGGKRVKPKGIGADSMGFDLKKEDKDE